MLQEVNQLLSVVKITGPTRLSHPMMAEVYSDRLAGLTLVFETFHQLLISQGTRPNVPNSNSVSCKSNGRSP